MISLGQLTRQRGHGQSETEHAQRPKDPRRDRVSKERPRPSEFLMSRDPYADAGHDEDSEQKRSQKTERAMFHQLLIDRARLVLE
jgi:hypothetical protein